MRIQAFGRAYAEEMLLPVRPVYVVATLLVAFMCNLLPFTGWVLAMRPDFVALSLLYWGVEHPRKVGFLPAFLLGLSMDVVDGSLFGQHALAYSVLMATAIALHRRLPLFGARGQMLHIFGLLVLTLLIVLAVREAAGNDYPGWWYFLPSVTGTLVWPIARHMMTVPLRPRSNPEAL